MCGSTTAGRSQQYSKTSGGTWPRSNPTSFWLPSQTGLANTVIQSIRKMSAPAVERLKAYLREHLPTDRNGRIAYAARANAVKGSVPV